MSDILHTGGCRCGAVRFAAAAEPDHVGFCHCVDCRRATGAPYVGFVGFMVPDVTYDGSAARYQNGMVARSFCATCGSPLAYEDERLPGHVYFYLGSMDRPQDFRPTLHAYVSQKLPYVHLGDGLPQLDRTSVPRPDGAHP